DRAGKSAFKRGSGLFTKHKVFQEANIKVLQRQKHRLHKVALHLHPTHCSCSLKFLRPGPFQLGASLPPSGCGLASASASVSTTASPARQVLSVLPPGSSCSRGSLFHNRHHLSSMPLPSGALSTYTCFG